jgi:hypothetical protein
MKKILLFVFYLVIFFNLFSQKVEKNILEHTARNYFYALGADTVGLKYSTVMNFKDVSYYLVKNKKGHFLIMSNNYYGIPIIGYGNYVGKQIPEQLKFLLRNYSKIIEVKKISYKKQWLQYSKKVKAIKSKSDFLIQVKWNQGAGWNKYCPVDSSGPGDHVYAGCVAVSMAQAMSVFDYPAIGEGSWSYNTDKYGTLTADFGNTQYHWNLMSHNSPDDYNALLLYHCGVSVNMQYSASGSGAYTYDVADALKKYFKYAQSVKYVSRSSYSDDDWISLLKSEIDAHRPIVYSGDDGTGKVGHAFDLDGYDVNDYFHVNWGWSGSLNGYFSIDKLEPGNGDNFSFHCAAVIGIHPKGGPTDIKLSSDFFIDTLKPGDTIAQITVVDPDDNAPYTYKVSSAESGVNCPFYTSDDGFLLLKTKVSADNTQFLDINIKVTDALGKYIVKEFLILVRKENYPPYDLLVNEYQIPYRFDVDSLVAIFRTKDPDKNQSFVYTLVPDNGDSYNNNLFFIKGDSLFANTNFKQYLDKKVSIYARTTDPYGEYFEKKFVFSVVENYTAIKEKISKDLSIYPNPTNSGYIFVSSNTEKIKSLSIFDVYGRKIFYEKSNNNNIQVKLSYKGVFFVKIRTNKNTYFKKIIYR